MKKFVIILIALILIFMSIEIWGSLQKSLTDSETIEQAIARLIAVHEADPDSHMGVGESIEQHKMAEVIDHPAFSVLDDKMAYDRNSFDVPFVDIALFDHGLDTELSGLNGAYLYAGTTNPTQWLFANLGDTMLGTYFDFARSPRFVTNFMVSANTSQTIYIMVGELDEGRGFGFKIVNGTLYGLYFKADYSEQLVSLQAISANVPYKLEARVNYPNNIEFFINNVLAGSFASPVFPGALNYLWNIPCVQLHRDSASARELFIRGFYWQAELP